MKFIYTLFLASVTLFLSAQGIVNNGNKIVVGAGAYINVNGAGGNITNSTSGVDGSFDNDGVISLQGNWINNSPNGAFINSGTTGTVILNGSSTQSLGGNYLTGFENLTLTNSTGATLAKHQSIKGTLDITSGVLTTTGYSFTLISDANGTARIAPITGNITGNITMQRYLPAGETGWRFLSAPVLGATLADWSNEFIMTGFTGSQYPTFSFVSVYTYDESAAGNYSVGYLPATNITNPIIPGLGYWCYISPGPTTIDVTGPPVKFNQTFSVSYSPSSGPLDDGYVMVGNPYPSSIDWSSSSWTKTNINNAIYIWNPQLQQYSSWVAGVGTNGGSNIIPSSQSFWVQANAANPALACNENVKSATDQSFIRSNNQSTHQMQLKIFGNGYQDETFIRFDPNATNYYDSQLDARKFLSDNYEVPSLSSRDSSGMDMSINSFSIVNDGISIPVKTTVGVSGSYTITGDSMVNMPTGFCIMLEDLATGSLTNLRTTTSYTFNIEDTTAAPRFLIHIGKKIETSAIASTCYGSNSGKAIAKGSGAGPWNYTWHNSSNSIIQTKYNSFSADTLYNLNAGVYSVAIADSNSMCGVNTQSITVIEPQQIIAGFVLSKDSVLAGQLDSIIVTNTSSGTTSYTFSFGDGSPAQVTQTPLPHSYATAGIYTINVIAGQNNCFDYFSKTVTVINANVVSIQETQQSVSFDGLVYPNPNNGNFNVSLPAGVNQIATIEIFNAAGSIIHKQELDQVNTKIELSNVVKGVYFYRLVFPSVNQTQNGKLIID